MLTVMSEVTQILDAIAAGDPRAAEQLLPLVYDELRKLASQRLALEKPGQTLDATGLVHEAYLRLVAAPAQAASSDDLTRGTHWNGRGHFFGAAAEAMRRILIEIARRKHSQRRGAGRRQVDLSDGDRISVPIGDAMLDLDEALTKLSLADPQAAEIVKLRIFTGMTVEEVADALDISPRTVKRNWAYARAWLGRALGDYDQSSD
jgi:RNA polymerase sigma factor (TIGR02999 family)